MEYSEKVVNVIAEAVVSALRKIILDNNHLIDTKMKNIRISGDNIKPMSITNAHLGEGSIDIAKIHNLSAEVANLVTANIENATIDTAQIKDLAAYVANITVATIETADITWAEIAELTTAIAKITTAEIGNATINYAQIEGLTAGSALITKMVGGKVGIADLAVTDANIVELNANKINAGTLSVERLVVVGAEKSIVYTINEANGTAQLSSTTIDGGSITRKTIFADQIVSQGITAECLNVKEIFANEALVGAITTANLNADEILANEAFISRLTTGMIESPEFGGLDLASKEYVRSQVKSATKNTTYIQYDEPTGEIQLGDVWIKTNKPDVTWNTLKDLTWEEVSNDIWGNWGTSEEPITHIWDGSSWIVISDLTAIVEMRTSIEQTSEQIKQLATKTELVDGELRKVETVVTQTAEKLESKADKTFTDKNGKTVELYTVVTQTAEEITQMVKKDGVIAAINLSSEEAYILAPKIKLEGLVTANSYFKVLTDGSIEATNAVISGKITATSGEIGGWKVDTGKLYSGSGANRVALSTSDATYAIWAGNETAANAPFRVGKNGSLFASNAEITGKIVSTNADITGKITSSSGSIGGWTLATGYMYSGSGTSSVYLSTTDSTYRIWAGNATASSAPFRVGKNGSLYASNAEITGKITSTNADITGKVTASSGAIGGWNIGTNLLYAGSGSNRVALSTGDATYAMWAGNETASSAPFRVTKDGKVYLTRVMALANETDTTPSELDLSNVAFWKLNRAVKTLSVSGDTLTIALYNGTSVNFKKATSNIQLALIEGPGSLTSVGSGVEVRNYKTDGTYSTIGTVSATMSIPASSYSADTKATLVLSTGSSSDTEELSLAPVYNAGKNGVTLSGSGWVNGEQTITASNDKTLPVSIPAINLVPGEWTDANNIVVVPYHGTKMIEGAKMIDGTDVYKKGRDSVSLSSLSASYQNSPGNINITAKLSNGKSITTTTTDGGAFNAGLSATSLTVSVEYDEESHKYSITPKTMYNGETIKTGSVVMSSTEAYKAGWDAAVAKIERDGNVIKGPSSTVDEQTNLFTITAGGSLNNITNTAANYFHVSGYAYAYIDGVNVASRSISKANQINVGQ